MAQRQSIGDALESVGDRIERASSAAIDHFGDTGDRFKLIFIQGQHTEMFATVACLCTIFSIAANSYQGMIWAENPKITDSPIFRVGMWSVDYGGETTLAVCTDWPAVQHGNTLTTEDPVCDAVKATRALSILATIIYFCAFVGGVVRSTNNFKLWPVKTIYVLLVAAFINMIAYIIWESAVQEKFEEALKETVVKEGNIANNDYYGTLGAAYALLLWTWILPLNTVMVKFMLPFLGFEHEIGPRDPTSIEAQFGI